MPTPTVAFNILLCLTPDDFISQGRISSRERVHYNYTRCYYFCLIAKAVDTVCTNEACVSNIVSVAQDSGIEALKSEASRLLAVLLKNARTSGNAQKPS